MRVPDADPSTTIRQTPSALCRSLSDELSGDRTAAPRKGVGTKGLRSSRERPFVASCPWGDNLVTREALRTVVRNLDGGYFFERTVRLRGITNQLRCIPINLVQETAIGRNPVIARSAGNRCVQTSRGAISWNLGARWILYDFKSLAVDAVAADVAVTKIGREHKPVIRRDCQPTQFGRQARACVDLHD